MIDAVQARIFERRVRQQELKREAQMNHMQACALYGCAQSLRALRSRVPDTNQSRRRRLPTWERRPAARGSP